MGYELLIRSAGPDKPLDLSALAARLDALQASGLPSTPDPVAATPPVAPTTPASHTAGPWSVPNGKGRLEARLFSVEGTPRGADFDVPFGGSEEELRRAIALILGSAETLAAVVFDPQLGREVGKGAVDEVVARWRQSQDWMVDVAGSYDDTRSLGEFTAPPPLVNRRSKIVLAILGGFIVIYWLIGRISDFLR